jgi:hypothetical protein
MNDRDAPPGYLSKYTGEIAKSGQKKYGLSRGGDMLRPWGISEPRKNFLGIPNG